MKEKPILFSAPMVRVILEGRKTMTRRVVKPQPETVEECGKHTSYFWRGGRYALQMYPNNSDILAHCPYGKPGDRLWVRETFGICDFPGSGTSIGKRKILYRADGETTYDIGKWKPSIFMRREYSRITLEITNVRVERLQDISEEDAKNEGASAISFMELKQLPPSLIDKTRALFRHSYRYGFYNVWENINDPGSWEVNPWVWVVEFKRIA